MSDQSYSKKERLKSKQSINRLFEKGRQISLYPIRIIWLENNTTTDHHIKVAFSVSKRNFKKAVDRNLLKRRMREAYRLNKHELKKTFAGMNLSIDMMIIYTARNSTDYQQIEKAMQKALTRLEKSLSGN